MGPHLPEGGPLRDGAGGRRGALHAGPGSRSEIDEIALLFIRDGAGAGGAEPAGLQWRSTSSMPGGIGALDPPGGPVSEESERSGELAAARRELVREARGPPRVGPGDHDRLLLEVLEALGQDVRSDALDRVEDLVEAPGAGKQSLHEQERPAIADAGDGRGKRGIGIGTG